MKTQTPLALRFLDLTTAALAVIFVALLIILLSLASVPA